MPTLPTHQPQPDKIVFCRGSVEPSGSPLAAPLRTVGRWHGRHRRLVTTATVAIAATTLGLPTLLVAVDGQGATVPPAPTLSPAIAELAPSHGSDQRLYNRADELAAERRAQRESAYGSDRRLYNRARELEAQDPGPTP